MPKIPKNLTDKDMLKGFKDMTIEEEFAARESAEEKKKSARERHFDALNLLALTPELIEKIDKALVEMKINLFKEGIKDYAIVPCLNGKHIVIAAVERKVQK